jgi:hypothetical protein
MLTRPLDHIRHNAVGYLALFTALAGTGYAATSLPRGSVGSAQLRNHAITPVKFNPAVIGGSVRAWAKIDGQGNLIASSGPLRIQHPSTSSAFIFTWRGKTFSPRCSALATVSFGSVGYAGADTFGNHGAQLQTFNALGQFAVEPASIAVIC